MGATIDDGKLCEYRLIINEIDYGSLIINVCSLNQRIHSDLRICKSLSVEIVYTKPVKTVNYTIKCSKKKLIIVVIESRTAIERKSLLLMYISNPEKTENTVLYSIK